MTVADRDLSQYIMTIDEAFILFDRAGLSRNKRTVKRNCENSQIDAVKLVAAFGPTWFLNPESVEGKIKKLQQFEDIKKRRTAVESTSATETKQSNNILDMSRSAAVNLDMSLQAGTPTNECRRPTYLFRRRLNS